MKMIDDFRLKKSNEMKLAQEEEMIKIEQFLTQS